MCALYVLGAVAILNGASSSSPWLFYPLLAAVFMVNVVGFSYGMSKYVFVPRLKNVGFAGPVMWLMVVLCIFPATGPFIAFALLFVPAEFVKDAPRPV